jgi:hypothetical protein
LKKQKLADNKTILVNCFNHAEKPAIGVCKSCGKGLCGDCLTERPNGIACKGSCEQRVDLLNRITDSDAETKSAARRRLWAVGLSSFWSGGYVVFAIGAYVVAVYFEKANPPIAFRVFSIVLIVASVVCILTGISQLVAGIFRLRRRMRDLRSKRKTQ